MRFLNVASGSKGNATFIYEDDTLVLVDDGLPLKRIKEALKKLGKDEEDIAAVLVTHSHSDHIKGLPYLEEPLIYTGKNTVNFPHKIITPYVPFQIGSISIVPFKTHHDAPDPLGFLFEGKNSRLGYVTDTGFLDSKALGLLTDCTYYYFESNYDDAMLENSGRPRILIDRIESRKGHLSNMLSSKYISRLVGPYTKAIYLAHLSEECNTPEMALKTHKNLFKSKIVSLEDLKFICCKQWDMTYGGDDEDNDSRHRPS